MTGFEFEMACAGVHQLKQFVLHKRTISCLSDGLNVELNPPVDYYHLLYATVYLCAASAADAGDVHAHPKAKLLISYTACSGIDSVLVVACAIWRRCELHK